MRHINLRKKAMEYYLNEQLLELVSKYVKLEKKIMPRGSVKYVGLCPFHNEEKPSFTVDADKQLYHCFGCGAGGDAITFAHDIKKWKNRRRLKKRNK